MRKKVLISLSLITGFCLVFILVSGVSRQKNSIIGEWYNLDMPENSIEFLQDRTFVLAPSFFERYEGTYNFVSPNLIEIETFDLNGKPYYKEVWQISFTINGLLKVHIEDFPFTYRRIKEKNGIRRRYYKSGDLFSGRSYKDGKLNGVSKYYYENGRLVAEASYKEGKLDGVRKFYDRDGNLTKEEVYKNGELISSKEIVSEQQAPAPK